MTPVQDVATLDLDAALDRLPRCRPRMSARIESFPLKQPFQIAGKTFETLDTLVVTLTADGARGTGEAAGVFYLGEDPETMLAQVDQARSWIEGEPDHRLLLAGMKPGGARNALDCALWDLQARRLGTPIWQLLGMLRTRPLRTMFTVGAASPGDMAIAAIRYTGLQASQLKLKLLGDKEDADRIQAVRRVCPGAWIAVDANRSLTPATLAALEPVLVAARVQVLEQPFAIGADASLRRADFPIPIAADESAQCLADIDGLADRYDLVNVKLDKCGGLTEALRIVGHARALGLGVMVGNMLGTALAMAPAWLVGQFCDVVDLDGPLFLRNDRSPPARYRAGHIEVPPGLWGEDG